MTNIAIFASGSGTNAENIIKYFSNRSTARVTLVLSNKQQAYALKRAANLGVDNFFFEPDDLYRNGKVLQYLSVYSIDFIVLAGFLRLIPQSIIERYPGRIINIHPALLPLYGGKGMYGDTVHKAVISGKESESGITIHLVNKHYDSGDIIFQARCKIEPGDTPETLAKKVHELEYLHYPRVIEEMIMKLR